MIKKNPLFFCFSMHVVTSHSKLGGKVIMSYVKYKKVLKLETTPKHFVIFCRNNSNNKKKLRLLPYINKASWKKPSKVINE